MDRVSPLPRVRHEPFIKIEGPTTWTTLTLTIHADGISRAPAGRCQPFAAALDLRRPRPARRQVGFIDYDAWWRESFGIHTPGGVGGLGPDRDRQVESGAGASAVGWRDRRQAAVPAAPAGRTLVTQGQPWEALFLLFDDVLQVEIDGKPW